MTSFVEDLPEFLKRRDGHTRSRQSFQDYYEYDSGEPKDGVTEAPWIDPSTPTNVTVVAGRTAILACVVGELGTASVRVKLETQKLHSVKDTSCHRSAAAMSVLFAD